LHPASIVTIAVLGHHRRCFGPCSVNYMSVGGVSQA
jgi:hypothetical protein